MRYKHFSKMERYELSILRKSGYSIRGIASELEKSPSSVSRELKRNKVKGRYSAKKANHKAYVRRRNSKYQGMKIRESPELERYIKQKLKLKWSPERISGRLKYEQEIVISYRVIYKYLYSQYGIAYCQYLKSHQYSRKPRKGLKVKKEHILNRVFIDQRPVYITQRFRFGHYGGDTMGRPKSASANTLVVIRERLSRKLFTRKVDRLGKTIEGFKDLFGSLYVDSLTLDNGVENIRYQELGIPTYFCHPYSSWEKGAVERGIGSIREFIPKKADLKHYSHEYISALTNHLNTLPMKCLGFRTPNEVFDQEMAKINNLQCCT